MAWIDFILAKKFLLMRFLTKHTHTNKQPDKINYNVRYFKLSSSSSIPPSGRDIFLMRLLTSSSPSPPGLIRHLGGVSSKQILLEAVGSMGGR